MGLLDQLASSSTDELGFLSKLQKADKQPEKSNKAKSTPKFLGAGLDEDDDEDDFSFNEFDVDLEDVEVPTPTRAPSNNTNTDQKDPLIEMATNDQQLKNQHSKNQDQEEDITMIVDVQPDKNNEDQIQNIQNALHCNDEFNQSGEDVSKSSVQVVDQGAKESQIISLRDGIAHLQSSSNDVSKMDVDENICSSLSKKQTEQQIQLEQNSKQQENTPLNPNQHTENQICLINNSPIKIVADSVSLGQQNESKIKQNQKKKLDDNNSAEKMLVEESTEQQIINNKQQQVSKQNVNIDLCMNTQIERLPVKESVCSAGRHQQKDDGNNDDGDSEMMVTESMNDGQINQQFLKYYDTNKSSLVQADSDDIIMDGQDAGIQKDTDNHTQQQNMNSHSLDKINEHNQQNQSENQENNSSTNKNICDEQNSLQNYEAIQNISNSEHTAKNQSSKKSVNDGMRIDNEISRVQNKSTNLQQTSYENASNLNSEQQGVDQSNKNSDVFQDSANYVANLQHNQKPQDQFQQNTAENAQKIQNLSCALQQAQQLLQQSEKITENVDLVQQQNLQNRENSSLNQQYTIPCSSKQLNCSSKQQFAGQQQQNSEQVLQIQQSHEQGQKQPQQVPNQVLQLKILQENQFNLVQGGTCNVQTHQNITNKEKHQLPQFDIVNQHQIQYQQQQQQNLGHKQHSGLKQQESTRNSILIQKNIQHNQQIQQQQAQHFKLPAGQKQCQQEFAMEQGQKQQGQGLLQKQESDFQNQYSKFATPEYSKGVNYFSMPQISSRTFKKPVPISLPKFTPININFCKSNALNSLSSSVKNSEDSYNINSAGSRKIQLQNISNNFNFPPQKNLETPKFGFSPKSTTFGQPQINLQTSNLQFQNKMLQIQQQTKQDTNQMDTIGASNMQMQEIQIMQQQQMSTPQAPKFETPIQISANIAREVTSGSGLNKFSGNHAGLLQNVKVSSKAGDVDMHTNQMFSGKQNNFSNLQSKHACQNEGNMLQKKNYQEQYQPKPCDLDKHSKILNQLQIMSQNLWDEVLDLRVQAAIQLNKLSRLDNPIVHEKLEELKLKAHKLLNKDQIQN